MRRRLSSLFALPTVIVVLIFCLSFKYILLGYVIRYHTGHAKAVEGRSLICSASRELRERPEMATSETGGDSGGDCGGRSRVAIISSRIAEER